MIASGKGLGRVFVIVKVMPRLLVWHNSSGFRTSAMKEDGQSNV
jgi:hypothetical protein